jgi:YaiO family outer membrane protein
MGLAADVYKTLWRGGYVNMRYQMSTLMTALPDHDVLIELYQAAGAWELSAGGRRMSFAETNVDFLLGSVVRYEGSWYFRLRGTMLRRSEGLEGSARAYIRRYTEETISDAAGFREVFLGYGREVLLVHPSRPDIVDHALSAGARVQVFPLDPLGASLGVSGSLGKTPWYAIHFGIIMRFQD